MIGTVLEISVTFVQFFASLTQVPNFSIPDAWKQPMYYVDVVNLNIPFFREYVPALNDFRLYFSVICVIIPLALVLFGLFFLNSLATLLWYVLLLTGVCLVVAAILASSLKSQLKLTYTDETLKNILLVGVVLVVAMLVVAAVITAVRHFRQKAREEAGEDKPQTIADVMEEETKDFLFLATAQRGLAVLLFGVVALLFLNVFVDFQLSAGLATLQFGLGITSAIIAFISLIWLAVGCTRTGRRFQWMFYDEMEKQFMRFLLITMSLLYIPVGAGVFVLFNCNSHSCAAGTFFVKEGSWLPNNNTAASRDVCIPCDINADQICTARNSICAGASQNRLQIDTFINCDDLALFNYAAFIIVVMYMIGVPLMFHNMVINVTAKILEDFPVKLGKGLDPNDEAAVWTAKVATSANSARFLYQPFIPDLKFTRLYQLLQKLLIVFTSVFVINLGVDPVYVALGASAVIHVISLVWLALRRPFLHKFENGIALVMEFALLASSIAALCIASSVDVPPAVFWTIIVLNGLLPVVAIVISFILEWTSKKSREEEEALEEREELEHEMQRRAQEEADAELAVQVHEQENGEAHPQAVVLRHSLAPTNQHIRERAIAAREAVEARRREEKIELLTKQDDCDHLINVAVKARLNLFLMGMGTLGFIALGLCIVGFFAQSSSYPTRWDHEYPSLTNELAGYDSWANFTSHCCCVATWGDPKLTSSRIVEQWTCDNGITKERIRSTIVQQGSSKLEMSGLAIRDVCAIDFASGCLLLSGGVAETTENIDSVATKVMPYCGTAVKNVTAYALAYLW